MACTSRIVDLSQDQNATIVCDFSFDDENGDPADLDGVVFTFTGKLNADDADLDAAWQTTTVAVGTEPISLSASSVGIAVGTYRYDIVGVDGATREVFENLSLIIEETVGD